jgi:hypothetical protein
MGMVILGIKMKRSQMIEAIVYEALSWDGLDTSGVPIKEVAADVLKAVEKFGMLPPSYEFKMGDKLIRDNCWEPEND